MADGSKMVMTPKKSGSFFDEKKIPHGCSRAVPHSNRIAAFFKSLRSNKKIC
jgi:hypothetical protein